MIEPENRAAYWRRISVAAVIGAAIALFGFAHASLATGRGVVRAFAIALVFSACIAPLLGWAMPRLASRLSCRLRAPFNAAALGAAMLALALPGTALAVGVLVIAGVVAPADFRPWLWESLRESFVVTLAVGGLVAVYETMRARLAQAAAQARLASLESRLQPHFLFNTLNSIATLTREDPAGAERMTTRLASLIRSSLDAGADPLVPLDEELALVRDYLEIERIRFGTRLAFTIVSTAAGHTLVPRFSVQLLVENAVKHAVAQVRRDVVITVRAWVEGSRLELAVEDDGPGFAAGALPDGHGLALLRDRLALLFDGAHLRVDSRAGRTAVALDLPLVTPAHDARMRRAPERRPA